MRRVPVHHVDPEASLRQSRAIFDAALQQPCTRHSTEPGEPCWTLADYRFFCGSRFDSVRR